MQNLDLKKALYRKILLIRRCEEKIQKEYFKDEMKTPVHLSIGAEAAAVGVHLAMPKNSQFFGTYRSHAIYLTLSEDLEGFFGELYGRINGCAKGKAGSMHLSCPEHGLIATSAVVGTTVPVAAGAAWAKILKGENWDNGLVVCFFGDGATEEGAFYETLNFASLKKLPLLFVCEDNHLAIHSHKSDRQAYKSLKDLVTTFDFVYGEAEGHQPFSVYEAAQNVVTSMRETRRPGLMKVPYFRYLEHVGPLEDFDKGYRKKPEGAESLDPLPNLEKDLLASGCDKSWITNIDNQIKSDIDKAVEKVRQVPFADASELFNDVLTEVNR